MLVTKKTQGDIQIGHMCFALNSISTQCSKILFDVVKKICSLQAEVIVSFLPEIALISALSLGQHIKQKE